MRENSLESFVKLPEVFCPLPNWQWASLLSPKPLAQMVTGQTRAIHLWHERWRRAGAKINPATFEIPPKTLWQKIARKTGLQPRQTLAATPFGQLLHQFGLNDENGVFSLMQFAGTTWFVPRWSANRTAGNHDILQLGLRTHAHNCRSSERH